MPSSIHCTQKLLAEIPERLIDPSASGESWHAGLLAQRFELACKRIGYNSGRRNRTLDATQFNVPGRAEQLPLF